MEKKIQLEQIVNEFESLSELEKVENVNGGIMLAYAIMPGKFALNIVRKFVVLPK